MMKKITAVLVLITVLFASLALAEDLSALTDEELTALYLNVSEEMANRGIIPGESSADSEADTDMMKRMQAFCQHWAANRLEDMLALCAPEWRENKEEPKTSLFAVLANRTPMNYTVNAVSGGPADTERTVTVTALIDRHNGKDPAYYLLRILMKKAADGLWYVDPDSLNTTEPAGTRPAETPTPGPEEAGPEITDDTVLFYVPEGGQYYHLDPECRSVHEKFLPMSGCVLFAALNEEPYRALEPCPVCGAPARKAELPVFSSFSKAVEAAGETASIGGSSSSLVIVMEMDGRLLRSVALLDDRAKELFEAAIEDDSSDVPFRTFDEYAWQLPVSYTEEITAVPMSREELDALDGKTILELEMSGFTYFDAAEAGTGLANVRMACGFYEYTFETDVPYAEYQALENTDALKDVAVRNGKYTGLSALATNLDYYADGSYHPKADFPEENYSLMIEISELLAEIWKNGEPDPEAKEALIAELTEKNPQYEGMIREMVETFHYYTKDEESGRE